MARSRNFHSVLLAAGVLLMAACASHPASTPVTAAVPVNAPGPPVTPLLEEKFQRAAKHYEKFQQDEQTVYCKRTGTKSMPYTCLTESQLRREVEGFERWRNPVGYTRTPPG